jgi:hypothetical protein
VGPPSPTFDQDLSRGFGLGFPPGVRQSCHR